MVTVRGCWIFFSATSIKSPTDRIYMASTEHVRKNHADAYNSKWLGRRIIGALWRHPKTHKRRTHNQASETHTLTKAKGSGTNIVINSIIITKGV